MNHKPKLELTWIGKDQQPKLEPRILIEDQEKSYGEKNTENMLIYGDNLLALKALEQDFTGKIKCIYIDPPYNTGSAFEHYNDNLEHSTWLNLMEPRLNILKNLLHSNEGSIWISIDDDECHYLKVLCDEVFGRKNFINSIIWEKKTAPQANSLWFTDIHDHILVYAKNKELWRPNLMPRTVEQDARYNRTDDPRGLYIPDNFTISLTGGARGAQYARTGKSDNIYEITLPSGRKVLPPKGRCWLVREERYFELLADNMIVFAKDGDGVPMVKRFLKDVKEGTVPLTIWQHKAVGGNTEAKREVTNFNRDNIFATPKPERLIQRIIHLASNEGDWVLDSFLGSGTTAAVAHKMNRKWIGIELGEHCHTHCIPRLQKVCDGTDQGGISPTVPSREGQGVGWKGGGGFKYYYLAPSLLQQDKYGNWVINPEYNGNMLASAMAKHEGFRYQPDEQIYWKQGQSTEKDFIYTTTQFITVETLDRIHEEMQNGESLLICCKSFSKACEDRYSNITVKKIPKMLLGRCEFGKEDYSLNIINMPIDPNEPDFIPQGYNSNPSVKKKKNGKTEPNLFNSDDGGEE